MQAQNRRATDLPHQFRLYASQSLCAIRAFRDQIQVLVFGSRVYCTSLLDHLANGGAVTIKVSREFHIY